MRTSNGTLELAAAASVIIAMTGASLSLLAGQPTTAPATTASDAKFSGYNLEIVDGKLIFPGGKVEATLGNVIDALREQYTEANIVLAPGLAKLKVADLKLRAGRLMDELEGLRVATGGKFEIQSPSVAASTIDPTTGLPREGAKPNAGLFVLRDPPSVGPRERVVEAFNIGPYLQWLRLSKHPNDVPQKNEIEEDALKEIEEIIYSAIANFRRDSSDVEQPSWQYHRGATLLVVIGNMDSVEIARKIVNALPGMNAADSARARNYGQGALSPDARATAEDAFRKRYGLVPRSAPPSGQPADVQQEIDENAVRAANAQEAFRKRYGLAPATPATGQPAKPAQEPDTPK